MKDKKAEREIRQFRNITKKFHNQLPELLELLGNLNVEKLTDVAIGDIREMNDYLTLIYFGIKQELKKACNGLISKGFKLMDRWEFKKANDGKTELIVFYRSGTPPTQKPKEKGQYHKENYQIECLVEDILAVCNDVKSINYYKKVARCIPDNIIYRAIAEVKETSSLGEVKKSTGSIFTHLIKKYAAEQGINL